LLPPKFPVFFLNGKRPEFQEGTTSSLGLFPQKMGGLTRQSFLAAGEIELSNISGLIMVFLAATKRTKNRKMKLGSIIRNSIINTSVQTFLWINFSVAVSPNDKTK